MEGIVVVELGRRRRGELAHEQHEARRIERLLQVVGRSQLERVDGARDRRRAGDHDHVGRRRLRLRPLELAGREPAHQIDPRHARQVEIRDEHVSRRPLVDLERLLATRRDDDVEPFVAQHRLEDGRLVGLVFDEEHTADDGCGSDAANALVRAELQLKLRSVPKLPPSSADGRLGPVRVETCR